MKLCKVKYDNHPVLDSLELDFINADTGKPYDIVLFAGENGTGKTTILEGISTFLNKGSFKYFDYIDYLVDTKELKAVQPAPPYDKYDGLYDMIDESGQRVAMPTNSTTKNEEIDSNPKNIRYNGCIFSKARSDFNTKPIKSTTTKQLDTTKYDLDTDDDFTSLKQLLVDIENQDNTAYRVQNRERGNCPLSETDFYLTSKMFRFSNAFNSFFDTIKYDTVADEGSEKTIMFKKNGVSIPIDKLSTGEKQIVFRGAHLLKNLNNLNDSIIMIDEPELSMHPRWQNKILDYYTNLFSENNSLKSQLFFATHSELVLKSALQDTSKCLVIVLSFDNGRLEAKRIVSPSVLPRITSAETNYLAFNLPTIDYHIELYGYLQTKESKETVKACDTYIASTTYYQNNTTLYSKPSTYTPTGASNPITYNTLPTYIRNAIDHPDNGNTYTIVELQHSIALLIELCK
jgi:predicted ATPase